MTPKTRRARMRHRDTMRYGHPQRRMRLPSAWPSPTLPIAHYSSSSSFPVDGNDTYGDCGEAMAAHGDQTFTGAVGAESTFDPTALVNQYLKVSGGDNGLSEGDVVSKIWKVGIGGNPQAICYDAMDIDPTNALMMQSAIEEFGGVCFGFSCPDAWIDNFNPAGGSVWDVPAKPDANNGHFVWLNGVDAAGRYHVETWGSYAWLTQAGVNAVDPSAFCVFSPRMFSLSTGLDPTGATQANKAKLWVSLGGSNLVPGPAPVPTPTPVPVPTPTPPPAPVPSICAMWPHIRPGLVLLISLLGHSGGPMAQYVAEVDAECGTGKS